MPRRASVDHAKDDVGPGDNRLALETTPKERRERTGGEGRFVLTHSQAFIKREQRDGSRPA
jgi:hypothetical protein